MKIILNHNRSSSDVCVVFSQIEIPQEELNINKDSKISSSLPLLSILFHLDIHELYWYKTPTPNEPNQYQYYRHTRGDSLHLEYSPSIYMSHDLFYHALRENMEDLGEELEDNYRSDIIHVVIDKICGIVVDESSNHGREKVKVFVGIMFFVKRFVDKNILNDDCVICFEELGKEGSVMCTPCSHVFHEDCIAKWLANGNSCPICRRDLPDI